MTGSRDQTRHSVCLQTTRERHEAVEAAGLAMKPRKPARQPAAAEELAELLLDEPRQAFAAAQPSGFRAERLEVIADHLVQHALLGTARLIGR